MIAAVGDGKHGMDEMRQRGLTVKSVDGWWGDGAD